MAEFVQSQLATGRGPMMEQPECETPKDPLLLLVKAHLKMSHIHHDDSLLEFYIKAALKAAEKYSGNILSRRNVVQSGYIDRPPFCIPADHEPNGEIKAYVDVVGSWHEVPVRFMDGLFWFDLEMDCCWCGGYVKVEYCTGGEDLCEWMEKNPQVLNGLLKYVTHAYENRGDGDYSSWIKHSGALDDWAGCRSLCA